MDLHNTDSQSIAVSLYMITC